MQAVVISDARPPCLWENRSNIIIVHDTNISMYKLRQVVLKYSNICEYRFN